MLHQLQVGDFLVSTDRRLLDVERIHAFLTLSYWAEGVSLEAVGRSIEHSIPFGVYAGGEQVGFARVITDTSTLAYVADVYVEAMYRGQGLSKLLMKALLSHPDLQQVQRWLLGTRDAHGLYSRFGFEPLRRPERWMERADLALYKYEGQT